MLASEIAVAIETERLVLRRQRADDAAAYHELWTERDPRVPPHRRIGPDGRPRVEDIAAQILAAHYTPTGGLLTIVRKSERDIVGYCGLLLSDGRGSPNEPELAYELVRRAHGAGYATEAGQAVVAWADQIGHRRLVAGVRKWNEPSRRVLFKLGFIETGQVEPDADYGDSLITTRTSPTTAR